MTSALAEGLRCAYDWMQQGLTTSGKTLVTYFDGTNWMGPNISIEQAELGFPFETDDRVLIDERSGIYFGATYLPRVLGPGSFYLIAMRDANGEFLNGTDTYRLNVPADTPARDFWSAIVYSMNSKGFILDAERVGIDSTEMDSLQVNDDGSVDIYFAPEAPAGLKDNWLPTGEDFMVMFRLYGPEQPLFDRTWQLGDVTRVE